MLYSFDTDHAKEYGVDEAIMLHNLLFWLAKNQANNTNMHEGKCWTYNSAEAFTKLFPFWNGQKIRRILISLENKGAIISGSFNKKAYDKTKWYSSPLLDSFFKNEQSILQKSTMDSSELNNGFFKNEQPIPDSKPNKKPDADDESFFFFGIDIRTLRQTTLQGKQLTQEQLIHMAKLEAEGITY